MPRATLNSGPLRPAQELPGAALLFLLWAWGWLAMGCTPRVERVVLVSVDTLRADHVGVYGSDWGATPTFDGLAARGLRFEHAISPAPLTLPAHTSLMTALDPPHHGVRNNSTFRLDEGIVTLAERMRQRGFATGAFVGAIVLDRQYGLARGFDHYDDQMAPRRAAGDFGYPERTADQVVDSAIAWLEAAPDRFFVWLHLYDPHAAYKPPREHMRPNHPYAGEIGFADAQVGRLLDFVSARWPDAGTLTVLTSDHGEGLGEHGEMTHSLLVYDATQRVPLILAGPGVPRDRVESRPVRLVDVAPTILRLAGAEPLPDAEGRDLLAGLEGAPPLAYVETLATQLDLDWSPLLGVRSERFKYIRAPRPELYDLAQDPAELRNLAAERPDAVAELDEALAERLADARPVAPNLSPDAARRAQLIELGYLVGEAGSAGDALGRVGGVDPKDGIAQITTQMVALGLAERGRADEALTLLEGLDDAGYVLDLHRSEVARRAEHYARAEHWARAALARAPAVAAVHIALAEAFEGQGLLDEAQGAFEEAARLDPAFGEPILGQGRIAESRADIDRAAALYERAAQARSGSAEALWRLAALRIEAGQSGEDLLARVPWEERIEPRAALRLARAEVKVGRRQRALGRLQSALRQSPGSVDLKRAIEELQREAG